MCAYHIYVTCLHFLPSLVHEKSLLQLGKEFSHGNIMMYLQKKHYQELENKAAALKRELDIQRVSVRQHKDKVQQLQELLATREQEHRYI